MENVASEIKKELEKQEKIFLQKYSNINPWGKVIIPLLFKFAKTGKLIRGSVLLETYSLLGGKKPYPFSLACAVEIIHSGLLIHDDIMDQDFLRRGEKTIPAYMLDKVNDLHTANSIAICAGDIAFFIALELSSHYNEHINRVLASEIVKVGLGQMQDVYPLEDLSFNSIISTYRFKTGRYTFSLPLTLGALLTDSNLETIRKLDGIGEIMGIIYQLEDDYLGIFGKDIGKEVGSDIRENKNTLYKLLLKEVNNKDSKKALSYFGKDVSKSKLQSIQKALKDNLILEHVDRIKNEYLNDAKKKIMKLSVTASQKECLLALLELRINRNK